MRRTSSIRRVNLLYLVTFLTLLGGSLLLADLSLGWRVVINQLVFLMVPLVLYLLITGQHRDLRQSLRLHPVSWPVVGLSLLIGLGLWHFDSALAVWINNALDYTIPLPPEALNVTVVDQVAMLFGVVILAPVVEELLFRGVIQSAYERRGPALAIVSSTVLFIMIHQELAQSVALVPVTLALGYVTWRSDSIVPAIVIHLVNNGQAMLAPALERTAFGRWVFVPSAGAAAIGAGIALLALLVFTRLTPRPELEQEPPRRTWLGRNWPVLPVVPIYAFAILTGILFGVTPEILALGERVDLGPAPWEEQVHWRYEIRNAVDERVGEAECTLVPNPDSLLLSCSMEQSAYDARAPFGYFSQPAMSQHHTVRWHRQTLAPIAAELTGTFLEGPDKLTIRAVVEDGRMVVSAEGPELDERFEYCYDLDGANAPTDPMPREDPCQVDDEFLAGGGVISTLMVGEWPWRLSALPFDLLYTAEVALIWPYRRLDEIDDRAPATEDTVVVVRTAEQVSTPAGDFVTWRVTVGDTYTAWYTVDPPHTLVAYHDEMVTWRLTGVE